MRTLAPASVRPTTIVGKQRPRLLRPPRRRPTRSRSAHRPRVTPRAWVRGLAVGKLMCTRWKPIAGAAVRDQSTRPTAPRCAHHWAGTTRSRSMAMLASASILPEKPGSDLVVTRAIEAAAFSRSIAPALETRVTLVLTISARLRKPHGAAGAGGSLPVSRSGRPTRWPARSRSCRCTCMGC